MYCKNCGAQIGENDRFCAKCGKSNDIFPVNSPAVSAPAKTGNNVSPALFFAVIGVVAVLAIIVLVSFVNKQREQIRRESNAAMNRVNTYRTSDPAVEKAKSYLNIGKGFSAQKLQKQLEYEGYSSSEARSAVNRCGADWNEQAAICAKSYLRLEYSWTKAKLRSQLEYEGFTSSQVDYGLSHCGKSW